MKPFDLEAAKRGEPVCKRDGTVAFQLAHFPKASVHDRVLVQWYEGCSVYSYSEKGESPDGSVDLFMAPRTRKGWIVLWKTTCGWEVYSTYVYDKKEEAEERASEFDETHRVVELSEWEE